MPRVNVNNGNEVLRVVDKDLLDKLRAIERRRAGFASGYLDVNQVVLTRWEDR